MPTEAAGLEGLWHNREENEREAFFRTLVFTRGRFADFQSFSEPVRGFYRVTRMSPPYWHLAMDTMDGQSVRETAMVIEWVGGNEIWLGPSVASVKYGTRFIRGGDGAAAANVPVEVVGRWTADETRRGQSSAPTRLDLSEYGYTARWPDRSEGGATEVVSTTAVQITLRLKPGEGVLGQSASPSELPFDRPPWEMTIHIEPDGAILVGETRMTRRE